MSTTLLYRAFGVRGYRYRSQSIESGCLIMTIAPRRSTLRCTACGSADVECRGGVGRDWQTVPIGSRPVFLRMRVPRLHCWSCNVTRQAAVHFAEPYKQHTRAFARYVLELRRCMTIKDVAAHLAVSESLVRDIEQRYLERHFSRPKLKHLTQIAIDEISVGKGHRYVTVVLDLESSAIVYVGQGKGGDALTGFWRRVRASGARIEAVATDLSSAYITAVNRHLPDAVLVFDRFHLVKLLNEELSQLRRELYREATDRMQQQVLKGTRWLLLKHPEHLDEQRDERRRLEEALALNHALATAYYLKEDLRQLWERRDEWDAERFLQSWCRRAELSGIRRLQKFAKTLQAHRSGILAWYEYPISTGPLEGINTKITVLKRQAYGFRNQRYFRLKLYALHLTRHELVG
jgi:transposase